MTDEVTQEGDSAPVPRRGLRPRHVLRGLWLLAALPLVFCLVAGLGLIGQEVRAPGWIVARVEAQAAAVLDGGHLRFGAITVTVGSDLHPVLRLRDIRLIDRDGAMLAQVPLVETTVSPRGLILRHEVLPQAIRMTGAAIALRRAADGRIEIALGDATAPVAGFGAMLDQFDRVFEAPELAALEKVSVEGLRIAYADARAGREWDMTGALRLDLSRSETRLAADLSVLAGRRATTVALAYASPRNRRSAEIAVTVTGAAAADIASQSPALNWLAVLDAPLSAEIGAAIDDAGALAGLRAGLTIGAGALAPEPGAAPLRFDGATAEMRFDPVENRIGFDRISVESDWGRVRAEGQALLADMRAGLPGSITGQFRISGAEINPAGQLPAAAILPETVLDLRLVLAPFRIDIGQLAVAPSADGGSGQVLASGQIAATPAGWSADIDAHLDRIATNRLLALWPLGFEGNTRRWYLHNVRAGEIRDLTFGLRLPAGGRPQAAMSFQFRDAEVVMIRDQPPVTGAAGHAMLAPPHFSVTVAEGIVTPPEGGPIDVSGTTFTIPDLGARPTHGVVGLATDSSVTAALSFLNGAPFHFLDNAGLPVTLAEGRARASGDIRFPMIAPLPPGMVGYDIAAALEGIGSAVLVPGRTLSAEALALHVVPGTLDVSGTALIDGVPFTGLFRMGTGPDPAPPRVTGQVAVSQAALDAFGIGLPRGMLSGEGEADVTLDLPRGEAPAFSLTSDLAGIGLSLPAVGWRKAPGGTGTFEIAGRLGAVPEIDRIALDAAGLRAEGAIDLSPGGAMESARFDRVRIGDWLDAPVRLIGRGDRAPGVELRGGTLDLRFAAFGTEDGGGDGGPMSVALDRLQVTEGIALTGFRGEFQATGGFAGQFTAALNGQAPVLGTVAPVEGQTAVRIQSEDAGAVLGAAGLIQNAAGGIMDLALFPAGAEGTYDGNLSITGGLRVHDAPALASLLNAVSVVGLIQQMAGQGLVFDEVMADFRIDPERITVLRSSAIGPGLGLSLDGIYRIADASVDFQGVISPFYLINAVGAILTRRGEGLIGFNFTLRGPVRQPQVMVNPLSALTPGMFREIFRRPPPTVD